MTNILQPRLWNLETSAVLRHVVLGCPLLRLPSRVQRVKVLCDGVAFLAKYMANPSPAMQCLILCVTKVRVS